MIVMETEGITAVLVTHLIQEGDIINRQDYHEHELWKSQI
jgi:hypothetical protein